MGKGQKTNLAAGRKRRATRNERRSFVHRIVCATMSVVLALGMAPTLAFADPAPDAGAGGAGTDASQAPATETGLQAGGFDADALAGNDADPSETAADGSASDGAMRGDEGAEATSGEEASSLTAQASLYADDPFYFKDYKTGQLVTTLHTSGTYELVKADGSPYTSGMELRFEAIGSTARKNYDPSSDNGFSVNLKGVDLDKDDKNDRLFLEDLSTGSNREYQIPSGYYQLKYYQLKYYSLRQKYRIVNDGIFSDQFDLSVSYRRPANNGEFSVKPYTEGKSDDDYEGSELKYDEQDFSFYEAITPEQVPFALASDTRLMMSFTSAASLTEDSTIQLESIGLWKADETLADYVGTYENEDPETTNTGKYKGLNREKISNVEAIGQNPSWPNYLNFNDDSKVTYLWTRGDGEPIERVRLSQYEIDYGRDLRNGDIIVDHANFSDAVAESGLYFPIVTATIDGERYVFAYFPIEVSATGTAERANPVITTASLKNTRVGAEYAATLEARSGAKASVSSTLSWSVTAGALPAGLALDAATGVISGTPTEAGIYNFTVTLTETVGVDARAGTRDFELFVGEAVNSSTAFEHLSLGEISYQPGTRWLNNYWGRKNYIDFTVPISLDVRDESLDLGETEVWWLVQLTADGDDDPVYYNEYDYAANLMGEDGTTMRIPIVVTDIYSGRRKAIHRVRVFLVPKHNDGSYAFDPGEKMNDGMYSDGDPFVVEDPGWTLAKRYMQRDMGDEPVIWTNGRGFSGDYAYYGNLPEMPYTALDSPAIDFGSWLHFPSLSFEGDEQPTTEGRIRIWRYNGTTTPGDDLQELGITQLYGGWGDTDFMKEENCGATFKLAPGTYAFTAEGAVPVYNEFGGVIQGKNAWVDIAGQVEGARAIRGTHPKQYLVTIGPNEGSVEEFDGWDRLTAGITYTGENIMAEDIYSATVTFEQDDGSYAEDLGAQYQVSWYRRTGADASTDVLVATGEHVSFGASDYPLYAEVMPTGRTASFWKTSSRQLVPANNKVASVEVPRKELFTGTFSLSCASGKMPNLGDFWGILEVKTPLEGGGYTTSNHWALYDTVSVPGITSGSTITFTPASNLEADAVSYTVPDETQANFTQALVAPMMKGTVSFKGLSFTGVDGTTKAISLDDGYTGLKVERLVFDSSGNVRYTVAVPHRQLDGSRIVLQPEEWNGDYYLRSEATYRLTVTHRDPNAPARMGSNASEYAAKQTFDVTLSPSQTSATEEAATLTSRGYADISLANPGNKACTLLLYDEAGNFVEKASANEAAQLRTPFLDAGTYELYAVDAGRLPDQGTYSNKNNLKDRFQRYYTDRISEPLLFAIEDGAVTKPEGGLTLPDWTATELVNRTASSVTATTSFSDKVTVTMHAELNEGVTLSNLDGARLEIQTNQRSGNDGQGFMNPDALNINGKAIALNRWSKLFNNTQNMWDGSLRIQIGEAAKINSACASFPMDMTLVIPRSNMEGVEASVWLVDGETRSLVGTYEESSQEISLSAPPVVAWQSFYVSGETAPRADVALYVGGMRAASAKADEYGYYTAEITLPGELEDFDEFNIVAAAQWTRGDVGYAVTSETQSVTYSTTFPALERITMCYQSRPGSTYDNIVTYYRGTMPNKYATIYRAENENNSKDDADHAKYFWIVEYANGDIIETVDFSVPRSDGSSVQLTSTEKLQTAESWIPDAQMNMGYTIPSAGGGVAVPGSETGGLVRKALTSSDLRSFVTMPEYFTYSPDELHTAFDFTEPEDAEGYRYPMQGVTDIGSYKGFAADEKLTEEQLTAYLHAMADTGYVRFASNDEAAALANLGAGETRTLAKSSTEDSASMANALRGVGSDVSGWMLVGFGIREVEDGGGGSKLVNPLLRVQYEMDAEDQSSAEMNSEIQEIMAGAQQAIDSYEGWAFDGKSKTVNEYKGNMIWGAVGTDVLRDDSCLYMIVTGNGSTEDSDVQVEMLTKYYIETEEGERTDKFMYQYARMDKASIKRISFDELNGQRTEATLTIAGDQVCADNAGVWDVVDQWHLIQRSINEGLNAGSEALRNEAEGDGDGGQGSGGGIGGQSALSAQSTLYPQWQWPSLAGDPITSEVAGYNITNAVVAAIDYVWPGKKTEEDVRKELPQKRKASGVDSLSPEALATRDPKFIKQTWDDATGYMRIPVENGVGTAAAMFITGGPSPTTVPAAIYGQSVPANNKCFWKWYNDQFKGDPPRWFEDPDDVDNINKESKLEKVYRQYLRLRTKDIDNRGSVNWKEIYNNIDQKTLDWCQNKYLLRTGQYKKAKRKQNEGVHDPSGIVYEAVLSNPVEGATVKLFTYNKAAGAFNLNVADDSSKLDEATFLDSTKFGIEENPQVTGADGRYQWFVPEGYWQVRVSKAGYDDFSTGDWGHQEEVPVYDGNYEPTDATETVWVGDYGIGGTKLLYAGTPDEVTASSYWMPVLPIQLDVNIPLVSHEAPEVASTEVTPEGAIITFSKYVDVESVTPGLFNLAIDGVPAGIAGIEALNADVAADGSLASDGTSPKMLATRFLVAFDETAQAKAWDAGSISVALSDPTGSITSYAGTALAESSRSMNETVDAPDFSADKSNLSGATMTLAATTCTYTGTAQKPALKSVMLDGKQLAEGTDFTVAYSTGCTNVGLYAVTITGKGGYTGTASATFRIEAAPVASASISGLATKTYTGKQLTQAPALKLGSYPLKVGVDYDLSYRNNVNAGTATVTVSGKGNFAGTKTTTFKINKAKQPMTAKAKAKTLKVKNLKKKKYAAKKLITLKNAKGTVVYKNVSKTKKLKKFKVNSKTGTITVPKGTRKGTYKIKVTVTAKGNANYNAGSKTVTVTIKVK